MFRRYPYWGWLLLCLVLWCINGYHFYVHRDALKPGNMAHAVNNDLLHREDAFNSFIKEQDLIKRLFTDSLTEKESERVNKLPFYIYCYDHDTLKFWNNNSIIVPNNDSLLDKTALIRNSKGTFVAKCLKPAFTGWHKRIVILFPLLITYPPQLENDYLKSHFVASEYIPVSTRIIAPGDDTAGAYQVTLHGNNTVLYLLFNIQDIQKWVPDNMFICLLIAALLASISWVHLMIIYFTRKRASSGAGVLITLGIITVLRVLLYVYGLPFHLDTLTFFSPSLYASSKYLSSFGDLFINTLCFLWIILFVTRHTPYKKYFDRLHNGTLRFLVAVVLLFLLVAYLFFFVGLVRSLVLDSNISFDVSHFSAINIYTIWGLLVVGTITGISCMVIYLFNIQFTLLLKNTRIKFVLLTVIAGAYVLISGFTYDPVAHEFDWKLSWVLAAWLVVFIAILDSRKFTLVSDLFEPHMIFWALFICAFCTGILQYFSEIKEQSARIAYVEQQLSPHRDNVTEFAFHNKINKLEADKQLKSFFNKPTLAARKALDQKFDTLYLTGPVSKYQSKVYLFDANGKGLFNKDSSVDYPSLVNEKNESVSTSSPYLFYKESILDEHYYLSYIRIYSDTINNIIGYVIVDLDLKKQAAEKTVNSELLQPASNKANHQSAEYAYAIYINDKLITQTNDYPFTTYLKNDSLQEGQPTFYNHNNVSELHYKIADKRTVVVVHYHSELMETITVFSYIFGILVLLAIIILLYQLYLSYFARAASTDKVMRLTLRRRVHLSMLAVVLLSFIIIGSVTVIFFISKYSSSNSSILQSRMRVAKQSVQEYLKHENAYAADYIFDSISTSARFKAYIGTLANSQNIDINIFDDNGRLFSTSQDEIYDKGLISKMMRQEAYYQLNVAGKSMVIQNEHVAGLSYLSAYEPLRDEHGVTLGYLNVPFFSSERDLNSQISNIVVTLINLYAFIFLISSVITVLITRWITSSFNLIIKQFGRINLQQNERITWAYDDEIGLLVNEYNKMVNKVEENAAKLAQSERETAWREMARQVAHEIKNPLTPMKLNIQYLQQAIRNDNPNIKELTGRVSESIIEQIDNLSYIASEFSNFAKMPEARPEELNLGELLHKAAELYLTEQHVKVSIAACAEPVLALSDRSQLLRVFTNLLENAKQAIPEDRQGVISIALRKENNEAIIAIADNGGGIDEETAKRIFQPYFTTKSSGTGLGLAMTRKIIEFWKGEIWFDTEEGTGTTFYIRLPLLKQTGAPAGE